jgi:hypothetical protein
MEKIAIIIFGDGAELGSFKVFADKLEKDIGAKYKRIIKKFVNRDYAFFDLIKSIDDSKEKIAEMHIFSHAIGAGLFLGYHDLSISATRNALVDTANRMGRKVTYYEVVNTEVGAIQTDDLMMGPIQMQKTVFERKFENDAFIKIWGCNSGVEGWVYSDAGVVDPSDTSVAYYWRAFNEFNIPKPSISKALATFFNRKVYGAKSGAHIEVLHNKKWIDSQDYKNKVGHWPSGTLPHRLTPDNGGYHEFLP